MKWIHQQKWIIQDAVLLIEMKFKEVFKNVFFRDLVVKFKELNENDMIGSVEIIQKNQVQIKSSMIGPWTFLNALFQGNFLRNFKNWFLLKIVVKNKHRTYTVYSEFFFIYCHRNSCVHIMSQTLLDAGQPNCWFCCPTSPVLPKPYSTL